MTKGDIAGLVLSYVYAFGLLFVSEGLGKLMKWPQRVTRKVTHIGAGMWIWGILALFDHWYYGIIPFATFIVLNYVFYRQQIFKAMDTEQSTLGTVYFAISITVLFAALWRTGGGIDRVPIAAAGVMAMTWGDAAASLVGETWGRRTYTRFGHTRSLEGTLAMAIVNLVAIFLTLWLLSGSDLSPNSQALTTGAALLLSVIGTAVATFAESISPAGSDNLSVPLLTSVVLFALYGLF
ncbi:MAG: phosphatidate cytidylyltransferase [Anaerolineae bacterium]|nr:phosphatidate cytidylyltransferase [Anaerolineae bacterium]